MKTLLCTSSALVFFALAACGEPDRPAPEQAGGQAQTAAPGETQLAKAETADEPEIGERIPDPETSSEAGGSSRLAAAGAEANAVAARGVTEIGWEELMPEGEEEKIAEMYQAQMAMLYSGGGIAEGSAADKAIQIGTFNTVDEILGKPADGMKIRLPGYTVPFEYGSGAEISEFLLVPYYGACLHAPPPPPNQTVYVETENKIRLKDLSQAVWIEGVLKVEKQESDLADAAYTIEMTGWEKYEY